SNNMGELLSGVPTENGIYQRHTTSENRYQWYLSELDEELDRAERVRVLDIGASKGSAVAGVVSELEDDGYTFQVRGVEPSPRHAGKCYERESVEDVSRAVVHDLPYQDGSFDLVVCHRLLPFLEPGDRLEGLDEMERVLTDDGTALLDLMDREEPDTRVVGREGLQEFHGEVESVMSDFDTG
ncbi:MAG: class I SAM-dependent methyltransferase, partial [Candidatus Nanohaloarchaea archaeon]|nr:class I SAM-dependent methyltransferase [Candidatus Nanohaloarchaea archaeon]